ALVDLRLHAGRRVEHGGVRARFLADADEVGQHRLGRERVDDARAGRAAGEAGGDHGAPEQLDRARDVDALPAGHRRLRDRAMAAADAEVRHLERLVDRRVEGDRDDHAAVSMSTRRRSRRRAPRARTTITTTPPSTATMAIRLPGPSSRRPTCSSSPTCGTAVRVTSGTRATVRPFTRTATLPTIARGGIGPASSLGTSTTSRTRASRASASRTARTATTSTCWSGRSFTAGRA